MLKINLLFRKKNLKKFILFCKDLIFITLLMLIFDYLCRFLCQNFKLIIIYN